MKNTILYLSIIAAAFLALSFTMDKKPKAVYEKPEVFEHPLDENLDAYNTSIYRKRVKKKPWIVVSDRIDNVTESGTKLDFKDWFYVIDETSDKIKLVKTSINRTKITGEITEIGWIEKSKMLLWTDALVDPVTRIDRKGFLLNTLESAERIIANPNNKEKVRVFSSPVRKKEYQLDFKRIYEFYFIYKKVKINQFETMYLIGRNVEFGSLTVKDDLIGWVKSDRLDEWNTRIALEPNFTAEATEERRGNKNLRVLGFSNSDLAINYGNSEAVNRDEILWDNDPIKLGRDKMSKANPHRFKGGVIRFPMLKKVQDRNYFRTGVVGEITLASVGKKFGEYDIIKYSNLIKEIDRLNEAKRNMNILYVVDGTSGMQSYVSEVSNTILKLKSKLAGSVNLKFGAAVYRDASEDIAAKKHFNLKKLTTESNSVIEFLDNIEAKDYNNFDPHEAVYFGLFQAMKKAGFSKNQTNIVVLIGDAGDYSSDVLRSLTEDATTVSPDDVMDEFVRWNAHLVAIQCPVTPGKPKADFIDQMKEVMLETAKTQYNNYKNIGTFTGLNFAIPVINQKEHFELENGTTFGRIIKLRVGESVSDKVIESVSSAANFVQGIMEKTNRIFEDGSKFDDATAGQFGPGILEMMKNIKLSKEDVIKLSKEKYQFYFKAYVPIKNNAAQNPYFSYVLFMPKYDLENLVDNLRFLSLSKDKTPDEQRLALKNTWLELLRQYIGDIPAEQLEKMSFEEIEFKMQGVFKEGIKLSTNKPLAKVKLADISKSSKKISDSEIQRYVNEVDEKYRQLKSILQLGKSYEFCYTSNGKLYYWIPIQYLP